MEFNPNIESAYPPTEILLDPTWDLRLAKWISNIFSPPVLAPLGIVLAIWKSGEPSAWLWGGFYTGMTIFLPVLYIVWKIHRGEISDFHIRHREQRIQPMKLTLLSAIIAWACLWFGNAPTFLVVFAGMGILQIGFFLLVTYKWKISGHGTVISSLTVLILAIFGRPAALVTLLVPLVAWARIRQRRHTLLQTAAGSLAGIFFMLMVLYLMQMNCNGNPATFC